MSTLLPGSATIVEATGVLTAEVLTRLDTALGLLPSSHERWVGIGCSWKRLENPQVGGASAPALVVLRSLLAMMPSHVEVCVHYSPRSLSTASREVAELVAAVPELMNAHALQLNSPVLARDDLRRIKDLLGGTALLVQLPLYRMSREEKTEAVEQYLTANDALDGVLIDGSGGQGSRALLPEVLALRDGLAHSTTGRIVGVSGGLLSSDLARLLSPSHVPCRKLVDCSSALRGADGRLDVSKALAWFRSADTVDAPSIEQSESELARETREFGEGHL